MYLHLLKYVPLLFSVIAGLVIDYVPLVVFFVCFVNVSCFPGGNGYPWLFMFSLSLI